MAAALTASAVVGPCGDIVLDPTATVGRGSWPWKQLRWEALIDSVSNKTLSAYLNKLYNDTSRTATIPSRFLSPGKSYTFTLYLQHVFLQVGMVTRAVVISSVASVPQVTVAGPAALLWTRSQQLTLTAATTQSPCADSDKLKFDWTVYRNGRLDSTVASVSANPRTFILPARSLQIGATYVVRVQVAALPPSTRQNPALTPQAQLQRTAGASVTVSVAASGVVARLAGGTMRSLPTYKAAVLDASSSVDLDYPEATGYLNYSWSCIEVYPSFGRACHRSINIPRGSVSVASWIVPAGVVPAQSVYNVSLSVFSPLSGASSAHSQVESAVPVPHSSRSPIDTSF